MGRLADGWQTSAVLMSGYLNSVRFDAAGIYLPAWVISGSPIVEALGSSGRQAEMRRNVTTTSDGYASKSIGRQVFAPFGFARS